MTIPSELAALAQAAGRLARLADDRRSGNAQPGWAMRLPSLLVLTDPNRTPDPLRLAERLPGGTALVYRTFGAADALTVGRALRAMTRRRRLIFLVGADGALAQALDADGVHLPERSVAIAPRLRVRRPDWLLTGAAHGARGLFQADAAGLDAVLLSTAFKSSSLSAGSPLGPVRLASLSRLADTPVYALGGVDQRTARRLAGTGLAGIAVVGAAAAAIGAPTVRARGG